MPDTVNVHAEPTDQDVAQLVHDEAADRVVGPSSGKVDVCATCEFVRTQHVGRKGRRGAGGCPDAADRARRRPRRRFLRRRLRSDNAGHAAVFVGDCIAFATPSSRGLDHESGPIGTVSGTVGATVAQKGEEGDDERRRGARRARRPRGTGDQAEDVIRSSPMTGIGSDRFRGEVQHVLGAVALAESVQTPAVSHNVGGAQACCADCVDRDRSARGREGYPLRLSARRNRAQCGARRRNLSRLDMRARAQFAGVTQMMGGRSQ